MASKELNDPIGGEGKQARGKGIDRGWKAARGRGSRT